jgi:hypothetical protein
MSNETITFGFLALLALSIVVPAIQRWNLRRLVRASIGIERICRKTDLVHRELRFSVLGSVSYSDGSKVIRVIFSFGHGLQGVSGNGWIVLDPVEVHTTRDQLNRAVEANVIKAIERARSYYTHAA